MIKHTMNWGNKKKKCEVWNFENVMHIPIFYSAVKYRRSDNNLKI